MIEEKMDYGAYPFWVSYAYEYVQEHKAFDSHKATKYMVSPEQLFTLMSASEFVTNNLERNLIWLLKRQKTKAAAKKMLEVITIILNEAKS